jgi:hypothetical protein
VTRRQTWLLILLFSALVLATRLPMAPGQLLTFDDVNLAYSVGHFDVRVSQPQPPGYPLFVMEMRVLYLLRFRHAEHILLALGVVGSVAALTILTMFGNRMFGGLSGFYAACLLIFHPVFWQTGVASALRMQLAVISLAAAASCWRAWRGDKRWVMWSAVVLSVGAGIRPETGPLLFPLWAASALRAPVSWKTRASALGAMAVVVLLWLTPTMIASGGPLTYIKTNLEYVSEQASVSSELFGATHAKAHATFWRLMVWTCFGVLAWAMPAVLAWRPKDRWGFAWGQLAFLALWFVPPFLFALSVHVEDPGQVLAMVPVIALFGGYLMNRAVEHSVLAISSVHALIIVGATLLAAWVVWFCDGWFLLVWPLAWLLAGYLENRMLKGRDISISRLHSLIIATATLLMAWIVWFHYGWYLVLWAPPLAFAAGVLLKAVPTARAGTHPKLALIALMLAPVLIVDLTAFNFRGWYYKGANTPLEEMVAHTNTGLELMSREAVEKTLAADDHTLRQVLKLAGERPGNTVVVFGQGMTTWRKAAYYAPAVPVIVLEHKTIRTSPPSVAIWKGNRQESFSHGAAPLRVPVPAGTRIVWLLNPSTEFYALVQEAFAPSAAEPVYFTDLPQQSGSRVVGEYELAW